MILMTFIKKSKTGYGCFMRPAGKTVPALVDKLYSLGIKNYWNFSHYDINPKYSDAIVEAVHLGDSLMTLCYRISENMI